MKQEPTVTLDAELVPAAKRYARSLGVSLSSLIEQSLREIVNDQELSSFWQRWRGQFQQAENDNARYKAPTRKYLR